jgi:hypothetical protein
MMKYSSASVPEVSSPRTDDRQSYDAVSFRSNIPQMKSALNVRVKMRNGFFAEMEGLAMFNVVNVSIIVGGQLQKVIGELECDLVLDCCRLCSVDSVLLKLENSLNCHQEEKNSWTQSAIVRREELPNPDYEIVNAVGLCQPAAFW